MKITHQKISPHPNPDDADTVGGEDWNAPHTLSGGRLIGVGWMNAYYLDLAKGAGIEITRETPPYWEGDPGIFLLRLLPSAGVGFGSTLEGKGIFVDFERRSDVRPIGYGPAPFTPEVAGICVEYMDIVKFLRDESGEMVYDGEGQPITDGLYYRARAVDANGDDAWEVRDGVMYAINPAPWMALKISVWFGVFDGGYNPDGSDDPVPGVGY